ncbi:MAG: hypothetical protein JRS35_16600 [Deltaproteobacteria bacterium]|nr:hypothetical protein [Deltaproteobacteria bacterium]
MRAVLALGTALAVCCVALEAAPAEKGLQAAPAETDETLITDLLATVQNLARRVEEMERERKEDQRRIRELEETLETVHIAAARGVDEAAAARQPTAEGATGGGIFGQGNLLNPQITAFFDMGGSVATMGDNPAHDRFNLREVELDFRAAVSPRADGVLILAVGEEIHREDGEIEIHHDFEIEEAFLDYHTLTEDLALKFGKFRNAFGRNNLLHTHDLPQISRPLAVQAFFGHHGLATLGASLSWIVPNPWDRYVELTTDLVNADGGEESPILGGPNADNPAVLGHLKFFEDVGETGSLELGASYLWGRTAAGSGSTGLVLGLDATYFWRDPERPDSRSLLAQGEFFWSDTDFYDGSSPAVSHRRKGGYAFLQYQPAQYWYTGLRLDYTEFPDRAEDDYDWGVSPYVSWYLNEALRLRLEYQHHSVEFGGNRDNEAALMLGVTFFIGAHPPHPYWVNR